MNIIPYMVIKDEDVQPKENLPYMQEDYTYIQWSKDYKITNENKVLKFLKENRNCLFLIECEDMEKISAFMTFVIYSFYRKQYARAYYERLDRTEENFWFLAEEAHNLLDSTTIQKKTFQKLRKIHNEFRNLKMHLVCVALRLQDMNPKIRSKMSIIMSRISLDDYQLKVRSLLRNSSYRDLITQLPKGSFVYPELDLLLKTEPFNQVGKPYEWKPKEEPRAEPIEEPIIEPKKPFIAKFFDAIFKIGKKKEPEPSPEPKKTKPRKPRAKKPKAGPKQEPTEPKVTMESLREVYSPDSQASKDYDTWKKKQLSEKRKEESEDSENFDQSVYSDDKEDTQESLDMEEDNALGMEW